MLYLSCEDFIVIEEDEEGNFASLAPAERGAVQKVKTRTSIKETRVQDTSTRNVPEKLPSVKQTAKQHFEIDDFTSKEALARVTCQLEEQLGKGKLEELETFLEKGFATDQVSLGIQATCGFLLQARDFDVKDERALIHLHTRMVFPRLKTFTEQKNGVYSVVARKDPMFDELTGYLRDPETVNRFLRFCHCVDKQKPAVCTLPASTDKECRAKMHRLIAKNYGSFLESKTFVIDGAGAQSSSYQIQARMRVKQARNRTRYKQGEKTKEDTVFTKFVLKKTGMETLEAIDRLSRILGVHPSAFSYAGTKDRKAVTLQNVSVKGVSPQRLVSLVEAKPMNGLTVGNCEEVDSPMRLGQLSGNHFQIIVRDAATSMGIPSDLNLEKIISNAINDVSLYGFINYFGPQRFGHEGGTFVSKTCDIGLAMLQGDMVQAVELIMTPGGQTDAVNEAKRYYQGTRDIQGTLAKMPNNRTRERLILKALHRHGTDQDGCTKALLNIPYAMRLLYVHSYTSLIWNHMATERVKNDGSAVLVGDLVCKRSAELTSVSMPEKCPATDEDASRAERGACSSKSLDCGSSYNDGLTGTKTVIHKADVHVVTGSDVRLGAYSMEDVVLPLPGYNIMYPEHEVGERYAKRLEEDRLTKANFRLRSLGLSLPGAYRQLISFPRNLQWQKLEPEVINKTTVSISNATQPPESIASSYPGDSEKFGKARMSQELRKISEQHAIITQPGTKRDHEDVFVTREIPRVDINKDYKTFQSVSQNFSPQSVSQNIVTDESHTDNTTSPSVSQNISSPSVSQNIMPDESRTDNKTSHSVSQNIVTDESHNSETHCGVEPPQKKRTKMDDVGTNGYPGTPEHLSYNLELSFGLEPSCYATVCLREIMQT